MSARLAHLALKLAGNEIRREIRRGATWADSHMSGSGKKATILIDSSIGFDKRRHPTRGKSPSPPTTILVEVA